MVEKRSDSRPLVALLGVFAVGAVVVVLLMRGGGGGGSANPSAPANGAASAPSSPSLESAPTAQAPSADHASAPVGSSAAPLGSNAGPPGDYPVITVPEADDTLTPEEKLKRQKHAIELLEDAIVRTNQQLEKAKAANDPAGVHTATIRLKRLNDVLAKRRTELGLPVDGGAPADGG